VAFAVRDNLEVAKKLGIHIHTSTVCGGGAKSKLWLNVLSNVLNITLCVPQSEEGPGYGAAILAMCACGDCKRPVIQPEFAETIHPDATLAGLYEKKYRQFTRIYPGVKDVFKALKADESEGVK